MARTQHTGAQRTEKKKKRKLTTAKRKVYTHCISWDGKKCSYSLFAFGNLIRRLSVYQPGSQPAPPTHSQPKRWISLFPSPSAPRSLLLSASLHLSVCLSPSLYLPLSLPHRAIGRTGASSRLEGRHTEDGTLISEFHIVDEGGQARRRKGGGMGGGGSEAAHGKESANEQIPQQHNNTNSPFSSPPRKIREQQNKLKHKCANRTFNPPRSSNSHPHVVCRSFPVPPVQLHRR